MSSPEMEPRNDFYKLRRGVESHKNQIVTL